MKTTTPHHAEGATMDTNTSWASRAASFNNAALEKHASLKSITVRQDQVRAETLKLYCKAYSCTQDRYHDGIEQENTQAVPEFEPESDNPLMNHESFAKPLQAKTGKMTSNDKKALAILILNNMALVRVEEQDYITAFHWLDHALAIAADLELLNLDHQSMSTNLAVIISSVYYNRCRVARTTQVRYYLASCAQGDVEEDDATEQSMEYLTEALSLCKGGGECIREGCDMLVAQLLLLTGDVLQSAGYVIDAAPFHQEAMGIHRSRTFGASSNKSSGRKRGAEDGGQSSARNTRARAA